MPHVYIYNIHKIFVQFILTITIFEENDQIFIYMKYN